MNSHRIRAARVARSSLTHVLRMLVPGIILVGMTTLTACSSGPVQGDAAPADASTSSPTVSQSTTPAAASGSRENPFPIGTPGKYDPASVWTITFQTTVPDAWPQISADGISSAPPAGVNDVAATLGIAVSPTAPSAGVDPSVSLAIAYVTAAGNSFDATRCMPPGTLLWQVGVMYPSATSTAVVCAQVPSADVAGGAWRVSSTGSPTSAMFFAGAPK